jgi:hypothetical protein
VTCSLIACSLHFGGPSSARHAVGAFVVCGLLVCASSPANAQSDIACGQVVNGSIAAPLEQDQFTFSGEQGDFVTFTLVQTGAVDPGFSVVMEVLWPPVTFSIIRAFPGTRNLSLPFTGTYVIRVHDNQNTNRGSYALRLGWLRPVAKQCGDRVPLSCGQVVNGTIAAPLEQDLFSFEGTQGSTVTFTLLQTPVDAGFLLSAEGYDDRSTVAFGFSTGIRNWTLPFSGTYVVRLRDSQNTRRGAYSFRYGLAGPCPFQPPEPPPAPPANLTAVVNGANVSLNWSAPPGTVLSYILEVGAVSGDSSLLVYDTGSPSTSFAAIAPLPRTYFVRVRARNGAGTSAASNEVVVVVGSGAGPCVSAPGAPASLTASVSGGLVTLNWSGPAGAVTTYVIDVGSVAGATDLASFGTANNTPSVSAVAPPGTYFVRVRARNDCGTGAPSNEIVVVVF